jgi:hypothetical protein
MARYALGQPVRLSTTITDVTGAPVNAGTLSLTVRKPDATQQTYNTPVNDSTGLYHQDIPAADLTQLGHHAYVWTATGAGAGVSGPSGFDVFDPFEVSVLSLQDGKNMLNIDLTDTSDDVEIQRKIASIESGLEKFTGGPIITRTISNERVKVSGDYRKLTVRYRPLVSVTSIVDVASGVAMSLSDLDPDLVTGIIQRNLQLPFWSRGPYYTVTYTAGWGTAVPPAIQEAAAVILQQVWETQRGGALTVATGGEETVTVPGFGYPIPVLAVSLLAPYALEVYV